MSNQHVSLHIKWPRSSLKPSLLFSLSVYAHVKFPLHKLFCRAMQITLNNSQVFRGEMIKQSAIVQLWRSHIITAWNKNQLSGLLGEMWLQARIIQTHSIRSVINHLHNQTFYWINIWQYYHESEKLRELWKRKKWCALIYSLRGKKNVLAVSRYNRTAPPIDSYRWVCRGLTILDGWCHHEGRHGSSEEGLRHGAHLRK